MSQDLKLLRKYYEGWKDGLFDSDLFVEDLTFHGPLSQAENFTEFKQLMQEMTKLFEVEGIEFKALFVDGYGNGCAVYDFVTNKPTKMRTECAELFHIEDGKIKEIRLIFDARQWEKILQPN